MAINERSRHQMYLKLEDILGLQEAQTLMEHLPPVGWADVATKRDLDQLAAATKKDFDNFSIVFKKDLDQVAAATKKDFDNFAASNTKDHEHMAEVWRRDLEATKHELIGMFRGEIAAAITSQTRTLSLMFIGALLSIAGVAFGAARWV